MDILKKSVNLRSRLISGILSSLRFSYRGAYMPPPTRNRVKEYTFLLLKISFIPFIYTHLDGTKTSKMAFIVAGMVMLS